MFIMQEVTCQLNHIFSLFVIDIFIDRKGNMFMELVER